MCCVIMSVLAPSPTKTPIKNGYIKKIKYLLLDCACYKNHPRPSSYIINAYWVSLVALALRAH